MAKYRVALLTSSGVEVRHWLANKYTALSERDFLLTELENAANETETRIIVGRQNNLIIEEFANNQ